MALTFDLIKEPFLPCVRLDGTSLEYGLRDALSKAHEIAEIHEASPLVTIGLHRLLLAILHCCYQGPKNRAARMVIRKAGAFDDNQIAKYFRKWSDRFDLLHEKYPFYQVAGFETAAPSGANRLAQELSCGNNAALFDHTTDNPPPKLTPAQAALRLIATQAFAVALGKSATGYLTNGPLVSSAVCLVRGKSLFETLWLNLTVYDKSERPVVSDDDDSPVWEQAPAEPHKEPARPRGYLDYLTWQTRTVHLHAETENGQVLVRRVSFAQGRKLELPTGFFDPMVAYARSEKEGDRPVRFNEFRDVWRESDALFQFANTGQFRGPTCLATLGELVQNSELPASARYRVSLLGLSTEVGNAANVLFWRHEILPLPLAYLDDPELVASLKNALALAKAVASEALRPAAKAVAEALLTTADMKATGKRPHADRVQSILKSFAPERLYWGRLENPFRDLMDRLPGDETHRNALLHEWYWNTLDWQARDSFARTVARIDTGWDYRAVVPAERFLFALLKKIRTTHHIPDRKKEDAA